MGWDVGCDLGLGYVKLHLRGSTSADILSLHRPFHWHFANRDLSSWHTCQLGLRLDLVVKGGVKVSVDVNLMY